MSPRVPPVFGVFGASLFLGCFMFRALKDAPRSTRQRWLWWVRRLRFPSRGFVLCGFGRSQAEIPPILLKHFFFRWNPMILGCITEKPDS